MIQVTKRAQQELEAFFEKNRDLSRSVRIYVQNGIWDSPSLELTVDDPTSGDTVIAQGEVSYIVDNGLMNRAGDITIDFMNTAWEFGFSITPSKPLFRYVSEEDSSPYLETSPWDKN